MFSYWKPDPEEIFNNTKIFQSNRFTSKHDPKNQRNLTFVKKERSFDETKEKKKIVIPHNK